MDLNLAGKVAVVTGAGKGVGAAVVRSLAAEGVDVVLLLASGRAGNVTGTDVVIDGSLVTTL